MTLIHAEVSDRIYEALHEGVDALVQSSAPGMEKLVRKGTISYAPPHPIYHLGRDSFQKETLEVAEPIGWRFLVLEEDDACLLYTSDAADD